MAAAFYGQPGEQAGLLPCGRWRSRQTPWQVPPTWPCSADSHGKGDSPLCGGATAKHEVHMLGSVSISWDHRIIAEVGRDPCSEQGQL